MTLYELYFTDLSLSLLFWYVVPATLILGVFIAKLEADSWLDALFIFGLCFLSVLFIVGGLRFALTYWIYSNQTVVDLKKTSVKKSFIEAELNCLLEPHDTYHTINSLTEPTESFNASPSVVFKDKTLIFFFLDKKHPKQSFQQIEKACLADWAAIKEQDFLNSVSKGGGR